jgi:hypothetical protein
MTPKLCKAGQQLRLQVDDSYPDRDKSSDGWIGNLAHSLNPSDHNPDSAGIVRAIDIDRDLSGKAKPDLMPYLADQIRLAAKRGDKRISYVIFAGRIASSRMGWRWRKYLELIRMTSIAIFLSLRRAIQMIRSLISR